MPRIDSPDAREELRGRLRGDRPAEAACGVALDAGAALLAWDETADPAHLLRAYGQRINHLRRIGARTVGSADLLRDLEQAVQNRRPLTLRVVRDPDFHYVVFVDVASELQACLGVASGLGNPDFDWDDPTL